MRAKVLIGYDGSPQGEDALGFGRRITEVLDAAPVVTMVIAHPRHGTDEREFDDAVTGTVSRSSRRRANAWTKSR